LPPQEIDVNVHPSKTDVKFRYSQAVYTSVVRAIGNALARAPLPRFKTPAAEETTSNLWIAEGFDIASLPILRVVGQLSSSYIMAEGPSGLYLIDQHAAHERILFEKVLEQQSEKKVDIQGLLEPLTIELSPKQVEILGEKGELISDFGFSLEHFGGHSYILRALPAIHLRQ
jgi:DNA mismatch repair protein MutL